MRTDIAILLAILGAVLSYIVIRSNSIFPAILMHVINNGTAVLLATGWATAPLGGWVDLDHLESTGAPLWLLGVSVVAVGTGVVLVERSAAHTRLS